MTFYYLAERVLDRDDGEDSLSLCVIQIYIVYLVEGVLDGDDGEVSLAASTYICNLYIYIYIHIVFTWSKGSSMVMMGKSLQSSA